MSSSPEPTKKLRAVNTPVTAKTGLTGGSSIAARKQLLQQAANTPSPTVNKVGRPASQTIKEPLQPAKETPPAKAATPPVESVRLSQPRRVAGLQSLSAMVSRSVPDVHEVPGGRLSQARQATKASASKAIQQVDISSSSSSSSSGESDSSDGSSESSSEDDSAAKKKNTAGVPKGKIGARGKSASDDKKKPKNSGFMGLLKGAAKR